MYVTCGHGRWYVTTEFPKTERHKRLCCQKDFKIYNSDLIGGIELLWNPKGVLVVAASELGLWPVS